MELGEDTRSHHTAPSFASKVTVQMSDKLTTGYEM